MSGAWLVCSREHPGRAVYPPPGCEETAALVSACAQRWRGVCADPATPPYRLDFGKMLEPPTPPPPPTACAHAKAGVSSDRGSPLVVTCERAADPTWWQCTCSDDDGVLRDQELRAGCCQSAANDAFSSYCCRDGSEDCALLD